MKYLSSFFLIFFLVACQCENQDFTFQAKLISRTDSSSPLANRILKVRYLSNFKGELGSCSKKDINELIQSNSGGIIHTSLSRAAENSTLTLYDSLGNILFDSILTNDIGNIYMNP
ncbi:MAG: hypothetical protein R2831_06700 [Chitinophagaceae bacterium]